MAAAERLDAVFLALSDPTRRALLGLLAEGDAATPTRLAREFPVSRQSITKHLAVLSRAGLVVGRRQGRETRYRLQAAPLVDAAAWMEEVGGRWDARLAALERHLEGRAGAEP
jgi:DNA-binding transcriptional ArsR family regulator